MNDLKTIYTLIEQNKRYAWRLHIDGDVQVGIYPPEGEEKMTADKSKAALLAVVDSFPDHTEFAITIRKGASSHGETTTIGPLRFVKDRSRIPQNTPAAPSPMPGHGLLSGLDVQGFSTLMGVQHEKTQLATERALLNQERKFFAEEKKRTEESFERWKKDVKERYESEKARDLADVKREKERLDKIREEIDNGSYRLRSRATKLLDTTVGYFLDGDDSGADNAGLAGDVQTEEAPQLTPEQAENHKIVSSLAAMVFNENDPAFSTKVGVWIQNQIEKRNGLSTETEGKDTN